MQIDEGDCGLGSKVMQEMPGCSRTQRRVCDGDGRVASCGAANVFSILCKAILGWPSRDMQTPGGSLRSGAVAETLFFVCEPLECGMAARETRIISLLFTVFRPACSSLCRCCRSSVLWPRRCACDTELRCRVYRLYRRGLDRELRGEE